MPKDIVLLLDGTSNEISTNRTNILRLYGALQKLPDQLVYYDPGVGTFGAENSISQTYRKGVEIWGMATGWGLDANVKEAYRFLVENYQGGKNPDRIHIFGFSRGAYCARILAGFLHTFGLMEKRNLNLLDYAYKSYKRIDTSKDPQDYSELKLYQKALQPYPPLIRFLGLFDTVASVIEWGRFFYRIRNHGFTEKNPSVQTVRHAVALDERRRMFQPQSWPEGNPFDPNHNPADGAHLQDAKEVWFTGVHGDIGGGYPENRSALAKFPLKWMIDESREAGLKYDPTTIDQIVLGKTGSHTKPNCTADPSNSLTPGWALLELVPWRKAKGTKRANLAGITIPAGENRFVPNGVRLHRSVVDRYAKLDNWPPHLPTEYRIEE